MTQENGSEASLVGRIVESLRQSVCAMRGHDSVLHFEKNKVMLRCTSCGHDSPGWDVGQNRPRTVFEGDAKRHLLRPDAMGLRRTA
jgi:hypothetical protein